MSLADRRLNDRGVGAPFLSRRERAGKVVHGGFSSVFTHWSEAERWLVISPHDDDAVLSGALLFAHARDAGIPVRVCIVSDGGMGYTARFPADEIISRRRHESDRAYAILGIHDLKWYDYPDTRLATCVGRRPIFPRMNGEATLSDRQNGAIRSVDGLHVVAGYTGLQNSIVAELRGYRPTRLFVCAPSDYHPDHKTVYQEVVISVFHSAGDIWPELGAPNEHVPTIHELAVYRRFEGDPDIRFFGDSRLFERKIGAIEAYESQTQIARLVEAVRKVGPVEFFRSVRFETYDPSIYANLFDGIDP